MPRLTENRETLIHRTSEQADVGKWTIIYYQRICYGWTQLYSLMWRMLGGMDISKILDDQQFLTIMSRSDL